MRIVEITDILQPTEKMGPRISQIQIIEIDGVNYELPIWSDENGRILWNLGEPKRVA